MIVQVFESSAMIREDCPQDDSLFQGCLYSLPSSFKAVIHFCGRRRKYAVFFSYFSF